MITPTYQRSSASAMRSTSLWLAVIAGVCLLLADIEVINTNPWFELKRMGLGLLNPTLIDSQDLITALANTLSFALQGMGLAVGVGFILALAYRFWWVRAFCAFIRAIHELFWALIFIQLFGLSPLTGVLALAIPYAGTLAKIYGELFEETDPDPGQNLLSTSTQRNLSAFCYTTLALAWKPLVAYTRYRFECTIRSTVVLGFIGLPTLGFYMETALREGHYSEGAGLLYVLLLLIASLRFWLRKPLLPFLILAAVVWLPPTASISAETIVRFFTQDIIPSPLLLASQNGLLDSASGITESLIQLGQWFNYLWQQQLWPGISQTLILSQVALLATALVTLVCFPLNSPHFVNPLARRLGDGLLIIGRTLPEYLLAFITLILWGPSMLPAIVALALHNGAILAHLLGRFSEDQPLRDDACTGINRYAYEILPRIFRQLLGLLLYRWEVIMRESAILGILGIATLGFYIDSAFAEFRFDRAALLILASALLNMGVDTFARFLRKRLHLQTTPETC
jgi:phosphonate transport system permease protein